MTRRKTSDTASIIDGVCGDNNIAELWASKFKDLLNTNNNSCGDFSQLINGNISFSSLSDLSVTLLWMLEGLYGTLRLGKKTLIILVLVICVMLLLLLLHHLRHCLHPF